MRRVIAARMVEVMNSGNPARSEFWLAGRFTPRQVDWIVVAAAMLFSVPALAHAATVTHDSVAVALAMLPFGTVPLLWRRTYPGPVLVVVAAAFAVSATFTDRDPMAAGVLFAVFAAALYGDRRTRIVAGVFALGAMATAFATVLATGEARTLGHLAGTAFGSGAAWVFGDRTRTRRAYLVQLEERAARLEREQEELARRATEEERGRIARELHDVVAHNVSVIAVQAGAARSTSTGNLEQAAETLGVIERIARSTLAELRTLLGVLRKGERERPALGPQPTLARINALVRGAREAGLHLTLRLEGDVGDLPAALDLTAYRIVQEALTNALKHAPCARVDVLVRRDVRDLHIVVADNGPGTSEQASGGQGLIGMRERATLVGGILDAGLAPNGGFRVEARLPLQMPGSGETQAFTLADPPRAERP
jgi:signal transduction histidine kinase